MNHKNNRSHSQNIYVKSLTAQGCGTTKSFTFQIDFYIYFIVVTFSFTISFKIQMRLLQISNKLFYESNETHTGNLIER